MRRRRPRTHRESGKNRRSLPRTRQHFAPPQTLEEFFALPPELQDRWIGVTNTVSKMRAGRVSLTKASGEFGLDPRSIVRLAKSALRKRSDGTYATKPYDKLLRVVVMVTKKGLREVATRDSRQATVIAEHSNAIQRYVQTGNVSLLQPFRGKKIIDASGAGIPLLTDLPEIDRLASAGILSFESLYARSI